MDQGRGAASWDARGPVATGSGVLGLRGPHVAPGRQGAADCVAKQWRSTSSVGAYQ
uniref:Uncharacterized protein n=1 Tax=Arundo donax TaxID=35708 RepID=A0A0A8ZR10_ARUDO